MTSHIEMTGKFVFFQFVIQQLQKLRILWAQNEKTLRENDVIEQREHILESFLILLLQRCIWFELTLKSESPRSYPAFELVTYLLKSTMLNIKQKIKFCHFYFTLAVCATSSFSFQWIHFSSIHNGTVVLLFQLLLYINHCENGHWNTNSKSHLVLECFRIQKMCFMHELNARKIFSAVLYV